MNVKGCKIFVFLFVVSSLVFIKQSYSQEADTLRMLSYFPLNTGNKWRYEKNIYDSQFGDTTTTFINVEVLGDTIMPNGKKYREVSGFGDILSPEETAYVRIDTANLEVYYYNPNFDGDNPACDKEINYFKLNLPDSVGSYELCYNLIIDYIIDYGQIGGLPDSTSFQLYFVPAGGPVSAFRLFKNFGIGAWGTGEGNNSASAILKAALIDGVQYGDFTVSVKESENVPIDFHLEQNFRNPFSASTVLSYSIEKRSFISLVIYNITGQEIKKLVDGFQPKGAYSINLNADELTSGVYFYKLEIDNSVNKVKKMLLLK